MSFFIDFVRKECSVDTGGIVTHAMPTSEGRAEVKPFVPLYKSGKLQQKK